MPVRERTKARKRLRKSGKLLVEFRCQGLYGPRVGFFLKIGNRQRHDTGYAGCIIRLAQHLLDEELDRTVVVVGARIVPP